MAISGNNSLKSGDFATFFSQKSFVSVAMDFVVVAKWQKFTPQKTTKIYKIYNTIPMGIHVRVPKQHFISWVFFHGVNVMVKFFLNIFTCLITL
jgi:hypothetical protein